jgi:hypothetical protein
VTRTDLANYVNNTPFLKQLAATGMLLDLGLMCLSSSEFVIILLLEHTRLKLDAKRKFDEALGEQVKAQQQAKTVVDLVSSIPEHLDGPHFMENGCVVVPNEQFLATQPFFVKTPEFYCYILRAILRKMWIWIMTMTQSS